MPPPTLQCTPPQSVKLTPDALARLETLLRTLMTEYHGLCGELDEYRAALAQADRARLADALARQQVRVGRLAELESHRLSLMRSITATPANHSTPTWTTSRILAAAPEPARSRLGALAEQLRPVIERAEEAQRVARLATQSLLTHTTGVMQQIQRQLCDTGTYTRHTHPPAAAAAPVTSALDCTS